jgi:hypothetical protein
MAYVPDPTVWPALVDILAAFQVELAKTHTAPAHYRHVPGLATVLALTPEGDECCEGVAWVRLTDIFASLEFPAQQSTWEPEGEVSWTVVTEIGVARCGGGPGPNMAPTDAQYLADVQTLMDDAAAMRRVGPNLKATSTHILDYFYGPGSYNQGTAEGNCMLGVMHLSVQVPACDAAAAG